MTRAVEDLSSLPLWGNARDMETLAKQMSSVVLRQLPDNGQTTELTLHAKDALDVMLSMHSMNNGDDPICLQASRSEYDDLLADSSSSSSPPPSQQSSSSSSRPPPAPPAPPSPQPPPPPPQQQPPPPQSSDPTQKPTASPSQSPRPKPKPKPKPQPTAHLVLSCVCLCIHVSIWIIFSVAAPRPTRPGGFG